MEKNLVIEKIDNLIFKNIDFIAISMNVYEINNKIIISSSTLSNISKKAMADELSIDFVLLCYYITSKMLDNNDEKEWFFKKLFIDFDKNKIDKFFNKDKYCVFIISSTRGHVEFLQSHTKEEDILSFMQELLKTIVGLREEDGRIESLIKISRSVEKITKVKILKN